ncbi:MAG TPA: carboxypeptidase-like regulatory domain-containing protein, partial [Candidatus Thermoplasmatota archaeon]|nr:carboxypeptidase-like regulatory domain-containing protein [Candidatus Thermoplasmatota archaeon]
MLRGLVVDAAIRPVAGAAVRLVQEDRTTATDAGGRFAFPGVGPGRHALQVHAPGFLLANTSAMPGEEVRIVLQPAPSNASYQLAYRFRGN